MTLQCTSHKLQIHSLNTKKFWGTRKCPLSLKIIPSSGEKLQMSPVGTVVALFPVYYP